MQYTQEELFAAIHTLNEVDGRNEYDLDRVPGGWQFQVNGRAITASMFTQDMYEFILSWGRGLRAGAVRQ